MSDPHSLHSGTPSSASHHYTRHPTSPPMLPAVIYTSSVLPPISHAAYASPSSSHTYRHSISRRQSQQVVMKRYQQPVACDHVVPQIKQLDRKLTDIEHQNFQEQRWATAQDDYLDPNDQNYDPEESLCPTICCVFILVVALFCLAAVIYLIINNQLQPTWPFWKQHSTAQDHSHLTLRSLE